METINTLLNDTLGPLGPLIAVGFLGVILIGLTLPFMLKKRNDPMDKLKPSKKSRSDAAGEVKLRTPGKKDDKFAKYSNFLEPQDAAEYSAIQLKLVQAGYHSKNAVAMYHFAQFGGAIAMLIVGIVYTMLTNDGSKSTQMLMASIMGPGFFGYMAPKQWVGKRQKKRQEEITNGFPDSLDLMLVCVEAGQSLDQSIIRVAQEIKSSYPALSEEFQMVAWEIKAGKDKVTVLRDMSERAGVTDVSSFVTVLIQSTTFGTSIAEALRIYAGEMRDKRVMRAEEKANTLPTKMTLATMMLTVPPLLIILLGPSVYNIVNTLGNMGSVGN